MGKDVSKEKVSRKAGGMSRRGFISSVGAGAVAVTTVAKAGAAPARQEIKSAEVVRQVNRCGCVAQALDQVLDARLGAQGQGDIDDIDFPMSRPLDQIVESTDYSAHVLVEAGQSIAGAIVEISDYLDAQPRL